MICPIMSRVTPPIVIDNLETPPGFSSADCLREECAWWDLYNSCCSVVSISGELGKLQEIFHQRI